MQSLHLCLLILMSLALHRCGTAIKRVALHSQVVASAPPFSKQYTKELRPLLGRSFGIAHKEILFLALRSALQSSASIANPTNVWLSALSTACKVLLDICFQFISILHYKEHINNEFGSPRVPSTRMGNWKERLFGFIAIRGLQRLSFLSAFYSLHSLLSLCSKLVAVMIVSDPQSINSFDTLGFEVSHNVTLSFMFSLAGLLLFKYLWSMAVKLTIADKVYLWGIGEDGQCSKSGSVKKDTNRKGGEVSVTQSLRASSQLVDHLDASFVISRLLTLYITPRILIACFTRNIAFFLAYIDVVFMVASHLLFLDRMLPRPKK